MQLCSANPRKIHEHSCQYFRNLFQKQEIPLLRIEHHVPPESSLIKPQKIFISATSKTMPFDVVRETAQYVYLRTNQSISHQQIRETLSRDRPLLLQTSPVHMHIDLIAEMATLLYLDRQTLEGSSLYMTLVNDNTPKKLMVWTARRTLDVVPFEKQRARFQGFARLKEAHLDMRLWGDVTLQDAHQPLINLLSLAQ